MKSALNLIWIDLEMTGLSPEHDRIIEIATVVTDKDLNAEKRLEHLGGHGRPQLVHLRGVEAAHAGAERFGPSLGHFLGLAHHRLERVLGCLAHR